MLLSVIYRHRTVDPHVFVLFKLLIYLLRLPPDCESIVCRWAHVAFLQIQAERSQQTTGELNNDTANSEEHSEEQPHSETISM